MVLKKSGERVWFRSMKENGEWHKAYGKVIGHSTCSRTGKILALVKCDGEYYPRKLPNSWLKPVSAGE